MHFTQSKSVSLVDNFYRKSSIFFGYWRSYYQTIKKGKGIGANHPTKYKDPAP